MSMAHTRRGHSATHLSCSKCVSLLFLNGMCCCLEASALMTSDSEDNDELMATWAQRGRVKSKHGKIEQ